MLFFVVLCPGTQPAVVLTGNGLKSHPTDWEKPGNEPATPGLHGSQFLFIPCVCKLVPLTALI